MQITLFDKKSCVLPEDVFRTEHDAVVKICIPRQDLE